MCEKCHAIDGKIAHYKGIASRVTGQQPFDGIAGLIEMMQAEKALLHRPAKNE